MNQISSKVNLVYGYRRQANLRNLTNSLTSIVYNHNTRTETSRVKLSSDRTEVVIDYACESVTDTHPAKCYDQ